MSAPEVYTLAPNLYKFFKSGDFADLTVIFGNTKIKAHKIVLCAQSKFFNKACRNFKEAGENVVTLSEGKEDLLNDMIAFMYRGEFFTHTHKEEAECECSKQGRYQDPVYYAEMYALADFYDVLTLRRRCAEHFVPLMDIGSEKEIGPFLAAAEVVYTTTPDSDRTLRDIVREFVVLNLSGLKDHADFKKVISNCPDLAFELIERSAQLSDGDYFFCYSCMVACQKETGCQRCGELYT